MPAFAFEEFVPVVDPTAYVHPSADLIGDVIVGAGCYVGPSASLRGDFGRIEMRPGSNVQDNCTLHSFPGQDCLVEEDGHVGHGVVLHGCVVGRNALVGMNSVVMDGAIVGRNAFVAAMSFVKAKFVVPDDTLVAGVPAKVVRVLADQEIAWKSRGTAEYQALARRCLTGLVECEPRQEPIRSRRAEAGGHTPLADQRGDAGVQS